MVPKPCRNFPTDQHGVSMVPIYNHGTMEPYHMLMVLEPFWNHGTIPQGIDPGTSHFAHENVQSEQVGNRFGVQ
jgi:hypothetical protein